MITDVVIGLIKDKVLRMGRMKTEHQRLNATTTASSIIERIAKFSENRLFIVDLPGVKTTRHE
jgi:hypothetical protein